MNQTDPNCLYHYTTVESLAMILKNRNIKFSPLTALDDRQEERVKDEHKYGKYVFVSAWTEEKQESIPMWNMHSTLSRGIRIKMNLYPFKEYPLTNEMGELLLPEQKAAIKTSNVIIPSDEFCQSKYVIYPRMKKDLLHKVEYTDDPDKLEPQIAEDSEMGIFYHLTRLGTAKNSHWSFQKEWRYILYFYLSHFQKMSDQGVDDLIHEHFNKQIELPFDSYYLMLDDESFEQMEITLSPKISEGNRILLQLLKDQYNPSMKIKESALFDTIR